MRRPLLKAAANAVGSAALAFAFALGAEAQTTIRVPLNYPTIQAAINAAANGDTVLVAPGTYVENINFSGKAITVTSESGPEITLIDGNRADSVVKFISVEGRSSVLSGFTVLNGRSGFDTPGFGDGGGIWIRNSSPTITGNIIANNRACDGLGISASFSSPLIRGNTIVNNVHEGCSGGNGGGISVGGASSAEIIENVIASNFQYSANGGGISLFAAGNPIIRGNIIKGNTATGLSPCASGGGIYMVNWSDALIVQNVITGNKAGCGGGIYWLVPTGSNVKGPRLVNNTIADNDGATGSAIYADGFHAVVQLHNNIIAGKNGQNAVYCGNAGDASTPVFRFNNVFSPAAAAYAGFCSDPTGVNGNISADPLFADPTIGDYRLQPASPSIDAGDNTAPQIPSLDLDGNARILDGRGSGTAVIDVGAYERATVLTPGSHDFGNMDPGAAPATTTFSITNPGATTLTISSISIGNRAVGAGGSSDFAVTAGGPDPCPSLAPTLAPGQSCTVIVTFTTPAISGGKGATLRVVSDAAGSPAVASLLAVVVVDTSLTSPPPPQRTVSRSATFAFTSNVEGSTFECKLDTEIAFSACTSPKNYTGLGLGPHKFQVRAVSKLGDADPTPVTRLWTIVPRAKRADFDGDAKSDILWRNQGAGGTGQNYLYPMDGTQILPSEGYLRTVADLNWTIAGTGDFDGDGKADILWRNSSTGENYIYFMDGTTIKPTEGFIRTVADQSWQVAGIGDFDGDGKDDIL